MLPLNDVFNSQARGALAINPILLLVSLAVLLVFPLPSIGKDGIKTTQPNVILINLDDADVDLLDESVVNTYFPNIKKHLQEKGTRFRNFHVVAPHAESKSDDDYGMVAARHKTAFPDIQIPRTPDFNEADVSDKASQYASLPPLKPTRIVKSDEQYRK